MEPSSLALIAIVLVWAAYLVPHWVRRRDQLTQNRTGDRDSSRLRLLSPRRRAKTTTHRSGGPVLSSPRVVIDSDGQPLFIPGERLPVTRSAEAVAARLNERKKVAAQASSHDQASSRDQDRPVAATASGLEAAVAASRTAARRRGRVLGLLTVALVSAVGISLSAISAPGWLPVPVVALLVVHLLASRVAAVRSRENLTVMAAQVRTAAELAARPRYVARRRPVVAPEPIVAAAVEHRPVAVGAETWSPVPVPPPTYTLKPAVHRPEPAPLNLPEAPRPTRPTPAAASAAVAAATRGALPRRPEDVERILALETPYPTRRAVNE